MKKEREERMMIRPLIKFMFWIIRTGQTDNPITLTHLQLKLCTLLVLRIEYQSAIYDVEWNS